MKALINKMLADADKLEHECLLGAIKLRRVALEMMWCNCGS